MTDIRCPECDIEVNDEFVCPLCGKNAVELMTYRVQQINSQEDKLNQLELLIQQHYIDTFELAWLNVPIEVAVQLLAKYAAIGWKAEEAARLLKNQKGTT